MRIIKEGKARNLEYLFVCDYCGCEFTVTPRELFTENSYIDEKSYRCPTCGMQVYGAIPQKIITIKKDLDSDLDSDLELE